MSKVVPTLDGGAGPPVAPPGGLNVTTYLRPCTPPPTWPSTSGAGWGGILRRALTGSGAASGAVGLELVD